MTITPEELQRIARLAELDVAPADLTGLAAQLDQIVGYVGQLAELGDDPATPFVPGPQAAALRPDRVDPIPLSRGPEAIAPEMRDGLFLVPRLPAMEEG